MTSHTAPAAKRESLKAAIDRKPSLKVILPALMLAMGISALDQQIVNTALPRIVADLGGLSRLSWIVTAFMLTQTITMPLYGKLSDLYGRKRMFVICISIFLLGSALCGGARSMLQLILFRGIQGLGAGGIYTLVSTTIGDFVSPRDRGRYQAYVTGTMVLCTVAGPVVGGLLTSAFTWRAVFLVNLPLGAIVMAVLIATLPRSPRVDRRVDYGGAVLVAVATGPLLLALSWGGTRYSWDSPVVLGLGAFALAAFALLILHERRTAEPILAVRLAGNLAFRWSVISGGLVGFAFYGSNVFLPLYFQVVLGMAPAAAGLMILPQVLGNLAGSVCGGRLVSWTGRAKPPLLAGSILLTLCFALLSWQSGHGVPVWQLETTLFVMGFGGSLCVVTLTVSTQNAVEKRNLGLATSSMTFLNSLMGAAGVALFGAILAARLTTFLESHGGATVAMIANPGMLDLTRTIPPVIAGAYLYAISGAFAISAILNLATIAAALKLPAVTMSGKAEIGE